VTAMLQVYSSKMHPSIHSLIQSSR